MTQRDLPPSASPDVTVSVVIPTRDRRELLVKALRSVLAQRSIDLQVVVVDDGSSDGSEDAVIASGDARVRVLRHDVPRGVAVARNAGARAATGSWLAFLDDDDLWAPDKLARQVQAATEARAAWAYAGAVEIDDRGEILGGTPPPVPATLVSELKRMNPMPAGSSNVLVETTSFRSVDGFDERLRHLADWDLWLRLAGAAGAPAWVPEPFVAYRLHASQATLDTHGMMAEGRLLRERHGIDLNSVRRWLAWSHLRRGDRAAAALVYATAAAAGDVVSLGRAAVASLHPRPTALARRGGDDMAWARSAADWIQAAMAAPR
ncbi:MAG TPA: glycosyltransferase [Actinomycetota bacterium]|jgi:glycosyltransferase involved in cell wall biosynthesis|nr:glycosyltransferase [Actinomycetota bacterium]